MAKKILIRIIVSTLVSLALYAVEGKDAHAAAPDQSVQVTITEADRNEGEEASEEKSEVEEFVENIIHAMAEIVEKIEEEETAVLV